jgi:hypothetical protein
MCAEEIRVTIASFPKMPVPVGMASPGRVSRTAGEHGHGFHSMLTSVTIRSGRPRESAMY